MMALPPVSQSSVAHSSATITGLSSGSSKPMRGCSPACDRSHRDSSSDATRARPNVSGGVVASVMQNALQLRNELRGLEPTPDEFRKIFRTLDPMDHQMQLQYGSKEAMSDKQKERYERQREDIVKETLGEQRFDRYLLVKDPWRIAMSTDHPNGDSFLAYPEIVQLLMDRTYRQEILKRVHPRVLERSVLKDLDREYTLQEIAIITRASPARILGLKNKGHLGVGGVQGDGRRGGGLFAGHDLEDRHLAVAVEKIHGPVELQQKLERVPRHRTDHADDSRGDFRDDLQANAATATSRPRRNGCGARCHDGSARADDGVRVKPP